MKKLKKSFLFLAVLLLLAGCQKKMTVQDYLNLGDKYLTEANYEEAIVAFTKAIELEPKAMKAYEGLAGAYIKTGAYDKAKATIQSGIAVYEGLTAAEQTDAYKQIYEALLKLQEEVARQLDKDSGEANSQSEEEAIQDPADREQEQLVAEAKEKYGDMLTQVITMLDSGNLNYTGYLTTDFENFAEKLEKPLIWQLEDGRYLGIYDCGHIYLGEMKNGLRSGVGTWYWDTMDEGYYASLFTGEWVDDYPNGEGTNSGTYFLDEESSEIETWTITGGFLDGYANGTIHESVKNPINGEEIVEFPVTRGVPDNLYQENGEWVYDATIVKPDKNDLVLKETTSTIGYEDIYQFAVMCAYKE